MQAIEEEIETLSSTVPDYFFLSEELNKYFTSENSLESNIFDIPGYITNYDSYAFLPCYLEQINYQDKTCRVKAILLNVPSPHLNGQQQYSYKLPSFVYLTCPLHNFSLVYNFSNLQEYNFISNDVSQYWEEKDSNYLSQIIPNLSEEFTDITKLLLSQLDEQISEGIISLTNDIDLLSSEPFFFKYKPTENKYIERLYYKLQDLYSEEELENRILLESLPVRTFRYIECKVDKCKFELELLKHNNIFSENLEQFSLLLSDYYTALATCLNEDLEGTQIMRLFLDEIDNTITDLIESEKQYECEFSNNMSINIEDVQRIMGWIRSELSIENIGNYKVLILSELSMIPIFTTLCSLVTYFDVKTNQQSTSFEQVFKIFLIEEAELQNEEFAFLVEEIVNYFEKNEYDEPNILREICTQAPPKIIEELEIPISLMIEIRIAFIDFSGNKPDFKRLKTKRDKLELLMQLLTMTETQICINYDDELSCFSFIDITATQSNKIQDYHNEASVQHLFERSTLLIQTDFNYEQVFLTMRESFIKLENIFQSIFVFDTLVRDFCKWKETSTEYHNLENFNNKNHFTIVEVQNLEECLIFSIEDEDMILEFDGLIVIIQEFLRYEKLIEELSNADTFSYLIHYDLSFVTNTLSKHLDGCVTEIMEELLETMINSGMQLAKEYEYLNDILTSSICSPTNYKIAESIKQAYSVEKLRNEAIKIFDFVTINEESFFKVFDMYYEKGFVNNLIDDQVIQRLNFPFISIIALLRTRIIENFEISLYKSEIQSYLFKTYEWLKDQTIYLFDYVKSILNLNYLNEEEMKNNPIKFFEENKNICSNFKLKPLIISAKNFDLLEQYELALFKVTSLKFTLSDQNDYSQDIYDKINNGYYERQYTNERELKLYDKYNYNNVPYGEQAPEFSIIKLLAEAKYILIELTKIELWLEEWIGLFPDRSEDFLTLIQNFTYPSLISTSKLISPLYEIINGVLYLGRIHQQFINNIIDNYPAEEMIQILERISVCIKIMRNEFFNGKNVIYNNVYDILEKKESVQEPEKYVYDYIDLSNYEDEISLAEDYVKKYSPAIYFMYITKLNNKNILTNYRSYLSEQYSDNITTNEILYEYEANNQLFDKILIDWNSTRINYEVEFKLQQYFNCINNIIVYSTMNYQLSNQIGKHLVSRSEISHNYLTKDQVFDMSVLKLIVILPSFSHELLEECFYYSSVVINNYGYINNSLKENSESNIFTARLLEILSHVSVNSSKYEEYDEKTEEMARDLESLASQIKYLVEMLQNIPSYLMDAQLFYLNGYINKTTTEFNQTALRLLTETEQLEIFDCCVNWTNLCKAYFPNGVAIELANLSIDEVFMRKCEEIHQKVEIIKNTLSQYQNINEESELLLPIYNGRYSPLALLYPESYKIRYNNTYNEHNIITQRTFEEELLPSFDKVVINDREELLELVSKDECLSFSQPIELPQHIHFICDIILSNSGEQLKLNCIKAYDVLYNNVELYLNYREGEEPFYLQNLKENTNYEELPNYVKVFSACFGKFRFEELKVAISTIVSSYYQYLYNKSLTGQIKQDDFREIFFVINDLQISVMIEENKEQNWKKGLVALLHEWTEIFEEIMPVLLSENNIEIEEQLPHFSYEYYNTLENKILVIDNFEQYAMEIGNHWLGASDLFDANLILNIEEEETLTNILVELSEKQSYLLVGSHQKLYRNPDLNILLIKLSRLLFKRYATVIISSVSFKADIIRTELLLLSGYIVLLIGVEYLEIQQVNEIVKLEQQVIDGYGELNYLKCEVKEDSFSPVYLENSENIGILLIFIPQEYSMETSHSFVFTEEEQLSERENKMKYSFAKKTNRVENANVVEHYEVYYKDSDLLLELEQSFNSALLISVESESSIEEFISVSEEHGKSFYEISSFLQELSSSVSFNEYDIPEIYNRVKDKSDNISVAIITLEYIVERIIITEQKDEEYCAFVTLLSNVITSAFGLDKNNEQEVLKESEYLAKLKTEGSASMEEESEENFLFHKYYFEYIQRYTNPEFNQYLTLYSELFNISLATVYDILTCSEYLKCKVPLLLVNDDHEYENIFFTIMSVIKKSKLFLVGSNIMLTQLLESNLQANSLVVIAPGDYSAFRSMISEIIGLLLSYPEVQNQYSETIYLSDDKFSIAFIIMLPSHIYTEFEDSEYCSLLSNKMSLYLNSMKSLGQYYCFVQAFEHNLNYNYFFNKREYSQNLEELKFATNSIATRTLLDIEQNIMFMNAIKKEYIMQTTHRLELLPSFLKFIFSTMFEECEELFNICESEKEIYLFRSLTALFLYRNECTIINNKQYAFDKINSWEELLKDLLLSEKKEYELLQESILEEEDPFTSFEASEYEELTPEQLQAQNSSNYEEFSHTTEFLKAKATLLLSDICGFDYEFLEEQEEILMSQGQKQQSKLSNAIRDLLNQQILKQYDSTGKGSLLSTTFEFSNEFIYKTFIHDNNFEESLINLMMPIIVSFWNAGYLIYACIHEEESGGEKELDKKIFGKLFEQFKTELCNYNFTDYQEYLGMGVFQLHCCNNEQCIDSTIQKVFNEEQLDLTSLFSESALIDKSQLSKYYQGLMKTAVSLLPLQLNDVYSYISYEGSIVENKNSKEFNKYECKLQFTEYQLGTGVNSNVCNTWTKEEIASFCNNLSLNNINFKKDYMKQRKEEEEEEEELNTKKQELLLYSKLEGKPDVKEHESQKKSKDENPYTSDEEEEHNENESFEEEEKREFSEMDDEQKIINNPESTALINSFLKENQVPVDILSENPLCFDSERVALATVVAAGMLSPITISVVGEEHSGKSILINLAKLLVRDVCESNYLFIVDTQSVDNSDQMVNQILNKFGIFRLKKPSSSNQWGVFLNYLSSIAFPSFHFEINLKNCEQLNEEYYHLFESHSISCDNNGSLNFIYSELEHNNELISLEDLSILVEVQDVARTNLFSALCVHMPEISEEYSEELLEKEYPRDTSVWIKQYNNGLTNIRRSEKNNFFTSYNFYEEEFETFNNVFINEALPFENMIEKLSLYESNGIELEDEVIISPITKYLKQYNDNILNRLNIHLFFSTLSSLGISQEDLVNYEEKINSLCLLGTILTLKRQSLQEPNEKNIKLENPWSDSEILLDNNVGLLEMWKAYILNEAILNAKRPIEQKYNNLHNQFTLMVQKNLNAIIPKNEGSFINYYSMLEFVEFAYLTGNIEQSQYAFVHFMELYRIKGIEHNPIVFVKVAEIFYSNLRTRQTHEYLFNLMNIFGKLSESETSYTGLYGENSLISAYNYIFENIAKYPSIMQQSSDVDKNYIEEEKREINSSNLEFDLATHRTKLEGFTLMSQFELKIFMKYLAISDCNLQIYNEFVREYQQLNYLLEIDSEYTIDYDEESDMLKKMDKLKFKLHDELDVQELLSQENIKSLALDNAAEEGILIDLLSFCNNIIRQKEIEAKSNACQEIISSEEDLYELLFDTDIIDLRELLIINVFRISILLALGINIDQFKFELVTTNSKLYKSIGIPLQSSISSLAPCKVLDKGRLFNMLPLSILDSSVLKCRCENITGKSMLSFSTLHSSSFDISRRKEPVEAESRKINTTSESVSINLIIPLSLFLLKTEKNITLYEIISRFFEIGNIMPTLFDEEELLVMCNHLARKMGVEEIISTNQLFCCLENRLDIIIVDDEARLNNIEIENVEKFGKIQLPINAVTFSDERMYYDTLKMKHYEEKIDMTKSKDTYLNENDIKLKELSESNSKYSKEIQDKVKQLEGNQVQVSHRDLIPLMEESFCEIPKTNAVFNYLAMDKLFYQEEFVLVTLHLYKYLSNIVQCPFVSLMKFSQMASEICDLILDKMNTFFEQYEFIITLYKFYSVLSEPLKAEQRKIDLDTFNTTYIIEEVTKQVESKLELLEENNELPSQKVINLETSATECLFLRNYLFTVIEQLKLEIPNKILIIKNAHIIAVAYTVILFFGINGRLGRNELNDAILSGKIPHIDEAESEIILSDTLNNELNFIVVALINDLGIDCHLCKDLNDDIKLLNVIFNEAETPSFNNENANYVLASQAEVSGQCMFFSEIYQILALDFPTLAVFKIFNIQWVPGDKYLAIMNSILLSFNMENTLFFVERDIAIPLSYCIAYLVNERQEYPNFDIGFADSCEEDNREQLQAEFKNYYAKELHIVDCHNESLAEVQKTIIDTFCDDAPILVINNFGVEFESEEVLQIITELLYYKANDLIIKDHECKIGSLRIKAQRDISQIPVIIGCYPEAFTLDDFLNSSELNSEEFIDNAYCYIDTLNYEFEIVNQNEYQMHVNLSMYIEQELTKSIFGMKYEARARNEGMHMYDVRAYQLMTKINNCIEKFIKNVVLSQYYEETEILEMHFDMELINKVFTQATTLDALNSTLLNCTFISSENGSILDFYAELVDTYRLILENYSSKNSMVEYKQIQLDVVSREDMEYLETSIMEENVKPFILQISKAISLSLQLLHETEKYHLPSQAICEEDSIKSIIEEVKSKMPEYEKKLITHYKDEKRENMEKVKNSTYLIDENILLYEIKHEPTTFKKEIISMILPFINEQLYKIFPDSYNDAIWLLNSLFFLAECEIIANSTKDIQGFIKLFAYSIDDTVKLSTSHELAELLVSESGFNIQKLFSDEQLEEFLLLDNISEIIPEICNMSLELQYAWLMFNIVANYQSLLYDSLPWFITNHSTFVTLAESENPFMLILCYYLSQDLKIFNEVEIKENCGEEMEWLNDLIVKYEQQTEKINELPPNFKIPNAKVFFTGFCLSCALNPALLNENIEVLSWSMNNLFGLSPLELHKELDLDSELISEQSIKNGQLPLEQCNELLCPAFKNLCKLCGVDFSDIEYNKNCTISHEMFQLINTVSSCMKMRRRQQLVLEIIYYDSCFAINAMLKYAYSLINAKESCRIPLVETHELKLEEIVCNSVYIELHPQSTGVAILKELELLYKVIEMSFEDVIYEPIFLLIPSNINEESLFEYERNGTTRETDENTRKFIEGLERLQRYALISYVYIQKSNILVDVFKHYLCIAGLAINYRMLKLESKNHVLKEEEITLRGLILKILMLSLLSMQEEPDLTDKEFTELMEEIVNESYFEKSIKICKTSPQVAKNYADLILFEGRKANNENDYIYNYYVQIFQALLFESDEFDILINYVLPEDMTIVKLKNRGIDEEIQREMDVKFADNESESTSTETSTSKSISGISSKYSERSELSDDEVDFDDSMSMFSTLSKNTQESEYSQVSQVSGISAASSINSLTFNKVAYHAENSHTKEENFYEQLMQALFLENEIMNVSIDEEAIEKSILNLIEPEFSKIELIEVKMSKELEDFLVQHYNYNEEQLNDIEFSGNSSNSEIQELEPETIQLILSNLTDFSGLFMLLEELYLFDNREFVTENFEKQLQVREVPEQQIFRRVFSLPFVNNMIQEEPQEDLRPEIYEKMPLELREFLQMCNTEYNNEDTLSYDQKIYQNLTTFEFNIKQKLPFEAFTDYWLISSELAPILGNIFLYLKIQNAEKTNSSLSRQRIIIMLHKPEKQPKIRDDGSIDYLGSRDEKNLPFYIELKNFELVGATYSKDAKEFADCSVGLQEGYIQTFDLYASCCVVETWEKGLYFEEVGEECLRVCNKYIPVPIKIGGYCEPIVLVEGKTNEKWVRKGVFFGAKEM